MTRIISDIGIDYQKKDLFVENTSVSGTYTIDWYNDSWNLVLTGDTTLIESNLPRTHRYSKVITIKATGDYTLTLPPKWLEHLNGAYDGNSDNLITVICVNDSVFKATVQSKPKFSVEIEFVRSVSTVVPNNYRGVYVSPDGLNLYVANYLGDDSIYWWKMTSPHDLGSLYFVNKVLSGIGSGPYGLTFKPDGTMIFMGEVAGSDSIQSKVMTTAWDLTTAGGNTIKDTLQDYYNPDNIGVSHDGTVLTFSGEANNIPQFTMSTPWDVSTLSVVNEVQIIGYGDWVRFVDEGNYVLSGATGSTIKLRKLGTAYDLNTVSDVLATSSSSFESSDGHMVSQITDLSYLYASSDYVTSKKTAQYKLTITGI